MKKNLRLVGLALLAAAAVFAFASCGDGGDGGGGITVTSGSPSEDMFNSVNITSSTQRSVLTGIAGYFGYNYGTSVGGHAQLRFFYKNKTSTDFNNVKTILTSTFSVTMSDDHEQDYMYADGYNENHDIYLMLATSAVSGNGITISAGTMIIGFTE